MKNVKYFLTKDYKIEDVIKWIQTNVPEGAMSGVTPVVEMGTNTWKVEYTTND